MDFDQTHWAARPQRGPLPTFYYHGHFLEMLDFVAAHYAHVLLEEHAALIQDFQSLSREAQCLYVRLVNRKGRIFSRNKLRYPELGDLGPLIRKLEDEAWVTVPGCEHYADVLEFLTRSEIHAALHARFAGMSRSLRKKELVAFARRHCEATDFIASVDMRRLLVQSRAEHVRYILFLYFGRIQEGLSQFTMRDLGLVRTQSFKTSYEPRFAERKEALEHFYYATRVHDLPRLADTGIAELAAESEKWPEPEFGGSAALRDKLAFELGRRLEQAGEGEAAIAVHGKGESTRCSERVVRLMLSAGRRTEAKEYLERCLETPRSDEEWLLARDVYEQKFEKKRTSALTDLLRDSEVIELDESGMGSPERAAVRHYQQLGLTAHRTENSIWRTFFGLVFWKELFAEEHAALHSPFEFLPTSLSDGSFFRLHRESIEAKLQRLDDAPATKRALLKTATRHYGKANGVFRWRRSALDALFKLLTQAPAEALRHMLRSFCEDYKNARYGYPDLMVSDGQSVRFAEIKAEGDQLRRNQMLRIRQLRDAGFTADVVRIRWVLDATQEYVVVDVETTGGRGESHRVTEIGAIKVRDGRIIDTFQTLLNPQRTIPPGITRLTGISAEMVAGAPCFVDIAADFETFMNGAIFVAHNVDFDYGFISREFARIGRPFRHAKLCTCASMRKLYPGHASYSLAALARAFDIPLKQHHRALCDAEAAAQLLLLINEKRTQNLPPA